EYADLDIMEGWALAYRRFCNDKYDGVIIKTTPRDQPRSTPKDKFYGYMTDTLWSYKFLKFVTLMERNRVPWLLTLGDYELLPAEWRVPGYIISIPENSTVWSKLHFINNLSPAQKEKSCIQCKSIFDAV